MREITTKKEMKNFFEENLRKKQSLEDTYSILINQGYPKALINSVYNEFMEERIRKKQEQMAEQPKPEVEIISKEVPKKRRFFGLFR